MTDEIDEEEWVRWSDRRARELAGDLDFDRLGEDVMEIILRWAEEEPLQFASLGKIFGMFRILIARRRRMGWQERSIREACLGLAHDCADDRSRTDRMGGQASRNDFVRVMVSLFERALEFPALDDAQPGLAGSCPEP